MSGLNGPTHGARVIAKLLMPWLFVSRKLGWTPFAKVRREGYILRARRKIRRAVVRPA